MLYKIKKFKLPLKIAKKQGEQQVFTDHRLFWSGIIIRSNSSVNGLYEDQTHSFDAVSTML